MFYYLIYIDNKTSDTSTFSSSFEDLIYVNWSLNFALFRSGRLYH